MSLSFNDFLMVLRIAMVVILYLFILQIILVARRDLKSGVSGLGARDGIAIGHLIVVDSGQTLLKPGSVMDVKKITTLGRGPTNDIVLESPVISTEHTRLYYQNQSLWVEDLKSRNGTFVNDRPVVARVAVQPGDIVKVGDVRFKLTK
jgi:pSer/pThr/pTyr-binding forkhead associated (FHA) protein